MMRSTGTPTPLPFFSMANKILTAVDGKAIDQIILDMGQLKQAHGEDVSPVDADRFATLRLLCDVRHVSLGNTLKEKDKAAHLVLREKFIDSRALVSRNETLEFFDNTTVNKFPSTLTAIVSALLFENEALAKVNTVINLAFNLLLLTVSMREHVAKLADGEGADAWMEIKVHDYDVLLNDSVPNNDNQLFLYSLLKISFKKLFELRALLMEQKRVLLDAGKRVSTPQSNILLLDAILSNFNLHEFPVCREKFTTHQLAVISSDSIAWWHYSSGCQLALSRSESYKDAFSVLKSRYIDIIQIYSVLVLMRGKELLREYELTMLIKQLLRSIDFDWQLINLFKTQHGEFVDEVPYLEMISSFLNVLRFDLNMTDSLIISPDYHSLSYGYYAESIFKMLLQARPDILLQPFIDKPDDRVNVFTGMLDDLQTLTRAHSTISVCRDDYAEMVVEYYLACLLRAKNPIESAIIRAHDIFKDPLFDEVRAENKGMYFFIFTSICFPTQILDRCDELLALCESKLFSLGDIDSKTNAVMLKIFFDRISMLAQIVLKSGTDNQKLAVKRYESFINSYIKLQFSALEIWADDFNHAGKILACDSLEIQDFQKSIPNRIATRVNACLVRSVASHRTVDGYFDHYELSKVDTFTIIKSIFDLAVKLMTAEKQEAITELMNDFNLLCLRDSLHPEDQPFIYRSRKMIKALCVFHSAEFGYDILNVKNGDYVTLLNKLKSSTNEPLHANCLHVIELYIGLCARILDIVRISDTAELLANLTRVINIVYRCKKMIKSVDLTAAGSIPINEAEKILAAFNIFTSQQVSFEGDSFSSFLNQLIQILYRKLVGVYQSELNTQSDALKRLSGKPDEMVEVNILSAQEIVDREVVIRCQNNCERIEIGFSRLGLYEKFKSSGCSKLSTTPSVRDASASQVQSRYKLMLSKLGTISNDYGHLRVVANQTKEIMLSLPDNPIYKNRIAYFIGELSLFYFEVQDAVSENPELADIVSHVEMIRLFLSFYQNEASKTYSRLFVKVIIEFSVTTINFNDNFTIEYSKALLDLLQYRFSIVLDKAKNQTERLATVKGLVKQFDILFAKIALCSDNSRRAAQSFVVNYFLSCMEAAEFPAERAEFSQLVMKIVGLISDPNEKNVYRLLLKIFSAKHSSSNLEALCEECYDWCQPLKYDLTKVGLISHHLQAFYSFFAMIDANKVYQYDPKKNIKVAKLLIMTLELLKIIQSAKITYVKNYIKVNTRIEIMKDISVESKLETKVEPTSDAMKNLKKHKRRAKFKGNKESAVKFDEVASVSKDESSHIELTSSLQIRDIYSANDLVEARVLTELVTLTEQTVKPLVSEVAVQRKKYQHQVKWLSIITHIPRVNIAKEAYAPRLMKATTVRLKPPVSVKVTHHISQPATPNYLGDATTASIFQRLAVTGLGKECIEVRDIFPLSFCGLHTRFISSFLALNLPVYVYGDYVSDAIYKFPSYSLSIVLLADLSRVLAILNDPITKQIYGIDAAVFDQRSDCIRLEFNVELLAKSGIAFKRTDLNLTIACYNNLNIKQVIEQMCAAYPLNNLIFYDVKNQQLLAKSAYLREFVVYPVFNPNPGCQVTPRLDVTVDHGQVINPGSLIIDVFIKLTRYNRFGVGIGYNLSEFIENNKHFLCADEAANYSLDQFDGLFITGHARQSLQNLSGANVLASLFPQMTELVWTDMWKAACVVDEAIHRASYDSIGSAELRLLQAQFLALSFYNTFLLSRDYLPYFSLETSDNYLNEVKSFLKSLPFCFTHELCEDVATYFYEYLHKDKLPQIYDTFMQSRPQQHYRNCDERKFRNNFALSLPDLDKGLLREVSKKLWDYHMAVLFQKVERRASQLK